MRRRNASAQNSVTAVDDKAKQKQGHTKDLQNKRYARWTTSNLVKAVVGHPLFGFVLFLVIFPGWTLLSTLQTRCADGDLPGCGHNNPPPVLVRSSQHNLYLPNGRLDGRCGIDFPSSADQHSSICDPFSRSPCCSQWGWCGSGPEFCTQAVKAPYNHTGNGEHCRDISAHSLHNVMSQPQ